jgi:uncharacterized membrane protein YqjE
VVLRPSAAVENRPGFFSALRRLGSTFMAVLHTRAELLTREIERERIRVTRLALFGLAALFFGALGVITLTILIIAAFWDSQRLVVIGFITLLYFGVAIGLAVFAKREAVAGGRPFSATVEQLRQDRDALRSQRRS